VEAPLKFQGGYPSLLYHGTGRPLLLINTIAAEKCFESSQWSQKGWQLAK